MIRPGAEVTSSKKPKPTKSVDKVSTKKPDRPTAAQQGPAPPQSGLMVPILLRLPAGLVAWLDEERFRRKAATRTALVVAILGEARGK